MRAAVAIVLLLAVPGVAAQRYSAPGVAQGLIVGQVIDATSGRPLAGAVNRTIELLRHMLNWAVGREYLNRTPFRRGTETLIRKLPEDNRRRRRVTEDEETRLLAVAPPFLRSMIVTALRHGHAARRNAGAALRRHRLHERHRRLLSIIVLLSGVFFLLAVHCGTSLVFAADSPSAGAK